jgi:hypothetical protein
MAEIPCKICAPYDLYKALSLGLISLQISLPGITDPPLLVLYLVDPPVFNTLVPDSDDYYNISGYLLVPYTPPEINLLSGLSRLSTLIDIDKSYSLVYYLSSTPPYTYQPPLVLTPTRSPSLRSLTP